jgi:hypothetical protein
VRQGDSTWMVHALLDAAVSLLEPVADAYSDRWAH